MHYNIKLYFSFSTSIEKLLNFKQQLHKLGGKQSYDFHMNKVHLLSRGNW